MLNASVVSAWTWRVAPLLRSVTWSVLPGPAPGSFSLSPSAPFSLPKWFPTLDEVFGEQRRKSVWGTVKDGGGSGVPTFYILFLAFSIPFFSKCLFSAYWMPRSVLHTGTEWAEASPGPRGPVVYWIPGGNSEHISFAERALRPTSGSTPRHRPQSVPRSWSSVSQPHRTGRPPSCRFANLGKHGQPRSFLGRPGAACLPPRVGGGGGFLCGVTAP